MSDIDGLDDDLFGNLTSSTSEHTDQEEIVSSFDLDNTDTENSVCPMCEIDHSNPLNLSGSELRTFRKYMDSIPPPLRQTILATLEKSIDETNPARGFNESFSNYELITSKVEPLGPIVRAVAQVLDEISDGKVTIYHRIYTQERELIRWHRLLRRTNNYAAAISEQVLEQFPSLKPTLDFTILLCQEKINYHGGIYIELGERYEIALDKQLVENGNTSEIEGSIAHFLSEGLFALYSAKA